MDHYKSIAHAKARLRYHIILSTKFRKPALLGIEQAIYDSMKYCESISHFKIIDMAVDKGDHIHLVVKVKPSLSVEQVVRRLKQVSTNQLWENEDRHLRNHSWGPKKRLWTNGYFCSTIGEISESVVLNYVRKQAK